MVLGWRFALWTSLFLSYVYNSKIGKITKIKLRFLKAGGTSLFFISGGGGGNWSGGNYRSWSG
jgi:hypothetical protein